MSDYIERNRELWNDWAEAHVDSDFYDVDSFRDGTTALKHVELKELGDVRGNTLLHLQCHFGLDTLSWAREGAVATGVDISENAIAIAESLADELDIDTEFVCCDVYDTRDHIEETFDIVFASYGAIPWLNDLKRWAAVVADSLNDGGRFYMVEFHPLLRTFDDDGNPFASNYFFKHDPSEFEVERSYASEDVDDSLKSFEWAHTIGDIVSALVAAGLRIDFVHEFPYSTYDCFPFLKEIDEQQFIIEGLEFKNVPLMFSIMATRD